jgi:FkbM family methyltransferase
MLGQDVLNTLSFIARHPLNRDRRAAALLTFLRWQVGSRLLPGPVAVPFVDDTHLLVQPGMRGATGNIYCGLHEFEDMGLVLHALRPGDVFVDVGANVGSYTVLAAGACGANVVAAEPGPSAFHHLIENIRLNALHDRVRPENVAVGAKGGTVRFSAELDTVNHVLTESEVAERSHIDVPIRTLDTLVADRSATLIKIDTEGYETAVVAGAERVLASATTIAVLMELNGSGDRYGFDEAALHQQMLAYGYAPYRYDPLTRMLTALASKNHLSGNTLYVRRPDLLTERVRSAPRHRVHNTTL